MDPCYEILYNIGLLVCVIDSMWFGAAYICMDIRPCSTSILQWFVSLLRSSAEYDTLYLYFGHISCLLDPGIAVVLGIWGYSLKENVFDLFTLLK